MVVQRILLCTVGTGDVNNLRASLLEPLKKSIHSGEWKQVILLPSQMTADNATCLQRECQDLPISIRSLPSAGAEDNADACFAHFNQVLEEVRASGAPPEAILVDFTRGTKAMSAALVLAAIRHDLPQLRYISGGQRDSRGAVVPGTEIVAEVRTTLATAQKRLDEAQRFFLHGNFAAVLDILPEPDSTQATQWPVQLSQTAALVHALASFYAAWDRLDYKSARAVVLSDSSDFPPRWRCFVPGPQAQNWLDELAQPLPDSPRERAAFLRLLIADLLANGERRLRDRHYEDAVIRGYRVLELMGQIRLFDHNLDSAALDPKHQAVQKLQNDLLKKGSKAMDSDSKGNFLAAREQVVRLLKRLGDPLESKLRELGKHEQNKLNLSRRNYSVWIHGFEAISGSDPEPIRALYSELEQLLLDDGGEEANVRLAIARIPDLSCREGT